MTIAQIEPPGADHQTYFPAHEPLFRTTWERIVQTYRSRALIRALVSVSLRTDNVGTILGYVWWLLDPLLLLGIYYFLVHTLLGRGGADYPFFILISLVAWKYFVAGVRSSIGFTTAKERRMRSINFPRLVLPVSALTAETFRFLVAFVVVVLAGIAFGFTPDYTLPLVIPIMIVQFIFTLGLAFALSSLNIFFRDVQHVSEYLFRAWFFLSPTLYPLSRVPQEWLPLYKLNPFATILPAYHEVLMNHQAPDFAALGIVAGASLVIAALACLLFVRLEPSFAKVH